MRETYCYIVVEVSGQKCFINRDMNYTDGFETVLPFEKREYTEALIDHHKLWG